ncbi:MAG: hypothetical protein E7291_06060 [Lachnospiraceae bacterium]|nr:hypothetical protein [Lachnospiraceae bacterium]
MIFKCKNCGGNVVYSPEKRLMYCPFCESESSEERKDYNDRAMTLCPECGGEISVQEHTAATQCPYCDNYIILNERVEAEYLPKLLIPFRMGKEQCKQAIRDKFKKCIFAPTDFLSEVRLNSMQGTYVPFWFYNYMVQCDFQGEGTKIRSWTTGNIHYTETSYYNVVRDMSIDFAKLPVDACENMPDDIMDLMEPYNYAELQEFKPEYLSGFYAEKYNMLSDVTEPRARQKMTADANKLVQESYSGYSNVRTIQNHINITESRADYGLLPVWKYIYHYNDQEYPFYVNGQTGKIVGTAPISKKKVWAYAGTLWACLTLFLTLLNVIVGFI